HPHRPRRRLRPARLMLRSLRHRLVLFTLAIVALGVLAGDLAMTWTLRDELQGQMERALDARVALVQELDGLSAEQMHAVLLRREIPAVVTGPDGARLVSRSEVVAAPGISETVTLRDGTRVEVAVSRSGTDAVLQRLYAAVAAGSVVALLAALIALGVFARRVLRPLDEALLAARTSEARSRRFLADAAHQLRTPVAGLRAASDSLLRNPEPGEHDQLLGHLAREAARTGQLLDALLRMAHLDRGDEPVREPSDLTALLAEEVERQQALAPSLQLRISGPDALTMALDAHAVREAVANLLDNARRHARAVIEITVRSTERDGAIIRISDDGPGLARDAEEVAFDRFVSLDDRGGSGLGLAIARGIARAHGGDLIWREGGFELWVQPGPDRLA
ncbi:MAG: HAMP domain-containing sensor histidine kinase, partial [Dehalococcoidia bacterium]